MTTQSFKKRALISVSNKEGLLVLATKLSLLGIELIASAGTAFFLQESGIPVTEIQNITGFPEILGGRVKTLHPHIYAGILARREIDNDVLMQYGISPIDFVIVNLYPFQQTIDNPNATFEQAIENIDIGGPTLVRAAAKNHQDVTVIVNPLDYEKVLLEIEKHGTTLLETRQELATAAFAYTAEYDAAIAHYLQNKLHNTQNNLNNAENNLNTVQNNLHNTEKTAQNIKLSLDKKTDLRYGENPHQHAALYVEKIDSHSLTQAKQLQGKPLSYNNLLDSDAALNCLRALDNELPACVIVKHATPCSVAQADSLQEAYSKALATDPSSAFGGIIAFNRALDEKTTQAIINASFVEIILAPVFSVAALSLLANKKNLRLLIIDPHSPSEKTLQLRSISGGILIQDSDDEEDNANSFSVVTQRQPTQSEMQDCLFAWRVARYVKSNAIVYAKNYQTLGIGGGQTSRVFSAHIAALKANDAGLSLKGAVIASDAFFPFSDSVSIAAAAGITAVIQPGGSMRDKEIIACANEFNLAMVFTHVRHFRH